MHQFVRARPLGGQQLQRLRELREAGDNEVRERHLRRRAGVSASLQDVVQPPPSRTVDAIVQERLQLRDGVSTATRLRDRVAASRRGMQTERSERPTSKEGALRPAEKPKTTRKIVAVRRRGTIEEEKSDGRRRMGRQEAEWIEKQLQYGGRVATMEKECHAAWQSFFAGAGAATAAGFVSAADVNKMVEELEMMREKDVQKMRHELWKLRSIANDVQVKVEEIDNGDEFLLELQEKIDAMETALARFRVLQSEQFEEFVLEEKVLEKELELFTEKMSGWENETPARLARGGTSSTSLGPRLAHLGSKSTLTAQRDAISQRNSSNNDEEEDACAKSNQDRTVRVGTPDEVGLVNRVRRLNDTILRSGGLKGGWDSREHATFTTLLVKCGLSDAVLLQHLFPDAKETQRSRASNQEPRQEEQDNHQSDFETRVAGFLRKCMRKVVTQTESAVRSHFDWYLGYLELVEEKRRAIQGWKVRKEEERKQIIQCGFEANGEGIENIERGGTPNTSDSSLPDMKTRTTSRGKTERLLEQWKKEKKQKEEEREQRRRELHKKREAIEAKRKQEQLDAKQKILLYKLQKEQEAMMLDRASKIRQDGAAEDGLQTGPLPFSSPTSKEELVERSRIAIEYAKAKRLRLQQIEERKQKQQQLPPRPEAKITDESENSSPKPVLVFNATETSKARDLSKDELRRKARRRERQSAHEALIPGEKAIPDVKFKSFGHVAIQPRAVPTWRKNL